MWHVRGLFGVGRCSNSLIKELQFVVLCYLCDTHENSGISCSISYMSYIGQCDLYNTCFRLLQVWCTPGRQCV